MLPLDSGLSAQAVTFDPTIISSELTCRSATPSSASRRAWLSIVLIATLSVVCVSPVPGLEVHVCEPPAQRLQLIEWLENREHDRLEQILNAAQSRAESDSHCEPWVENAFLAFANSRLSLDEDLDDWVGARTRSAAARLARAVYYWNLGLLSRVPRSRLSIEPGAYSDTQAFFELASSDAVAALEINSKLSMGYALLIHMAHDLRDYDELLAIADRALQATPSSIVVQRRYLDSLRPRGVNDPYELDRSLTLIETHLRSPSFDTSHASPLGVLTGYPDLVRGDVLAREGDRESAAVHYERALRHGEFWLYTFRRGINRYRLAQWDAALQDFDAVLGLRPQAPEVLDGRARVLMELGRAEEADADWKLALQLNPLDPVILLHRAYALRDAEQFDEAVHLLDQAMEFGASNEYVWDARGRIYLYDLQDFDRASSDLREALRFHPDSQRYRFNFAAALYKGRHCDAIAALGYYLRLCDTERCPSQNIVWVEQWREALEASDYCAPVEPPREPMRSEK